jgi:hypothetical protein
MAGSVQLTSRLVIAGVLLATVGPAMTLAGCRQSPPPPSKSISIAPDPLANARTAMDRHEYGAAAGLLRETLVRRPADLEAHYRLGVSASHLDRQDEARKEFEWVVAHGGAGTPEVRLARDWLATRTVSVRPAAAVPSVVVGPSPPNPQMATLAGRTVGPDGIKSRLQLFLKGVPGTAVKDEYHMLRTDQQGTFRFGDIVPGEYMLTDAIAGRPEWRLRVSLSKGEHLVLDLSPANQATVRDDFPEPRP